jgi:hypothetical protein
MTVNKVKIMLEDNVTHHEKEIFLNVIGNPWPLARALQKGNFTVSVVETETIEKETKLP